MQEWGFCDKENAREFSKDALSDSELEQKVISKKEAAKYRVLYFYQWTRELHMERRYRIKYSLSKAVFLESLKTVDGMNGIVHCGWTHEISDLKYATVVIDQQITKVRFNNKLPL